MESPQPIKEYHHNSPLMKLLCRDDDDGHFARPDPPTPPSPPLRTPMRLMVVEPPQRYRPEKIEPYAENYFPHGGAGFNYNEWTSNHIFTFLQSLCAHQPQVIGQVLSQEISGSALYSCFLNKETSEHFRRKAGYSPGVAMKLRMALGNIHNHFYDLI